MFTTFRHIALMILLSVFLLGCSNAHKEKPTVVVTIPPLQSLMREIVGDSVEVISLLDNAADPESFEPGLTDLRKIIDSDAYFAIGNLPVETNLLEKLGQSSGEVRVYDLSKGLNLLRGTHEHCPYHTHDKEDSHGEEGHHHHDGEGEIDPHVWSSYANMRRIAANMLEYLSEIDPVNRQYYADNFRRLDSRLSAADRNASEKLAPYSGSSFMVMHPSLSYFANDYALEQIPVGSENKELSIVQMHEAISEARDHKTDLIILEDHTNSRQSENLVKELNLHTAIYNPLDADWQSQLSNVVNAIIHTHHIAQ